jgi:tetratricopeptide (TPR) repeat protein
MTRLLFLIIAAVCFPVVLTAQTYFPELYTGNEYKKSEGVWRAHITVSEARGEKGLGLWADSVYNESVQKKDPVVIVTALFFKGLHKVREHDTANGLKMVEEAIELTQDKGLRVTHVLLLHSEGYLCYELGNRSKGLELMMRAQQQFTNEDYVQSEWARVCEYMLAEVYYQIGKHEEAIKSLPVIIENPNDYKSNAYQSYNLIGLSWRELVNYDKALEYFFKTKRMAEVYGNKPWIGIASGNIAGVYMRQGNFDKALPFAEADYNINKDRGDYLSEGSALIPLARINVAKRNPDRALSQLAEAKRLLDSVSVLKVQVIKQLAVVYKTYADAYSLKNDFRNAYKYRHLAMKARDSIEVMRKSSQYANVRIQLEAETHRAETRKLEQEKEKAVMNRNFLVAGVLSICILSLFLYRSQRFRIKLVQSEKRKAEAELDAATGQLNTYMESLREKNNMIEQFRSEIEHLQSLPESSSKQETIEIIEKLQRHTIITEDDWRQFKLLFDKVHKGFFIRLKEKYPNLTPAEIRLLALTKIKASTKEMAGMLGISPDSIKQARYRLRKKLDLPEETNLEEIIQSI